MQSTKGKGNGCSCFVVMKAPTDSCKCDEATPKCTACTRHEVECVYPAAGNGSASYNAHEELVEKICAHPFEVIPNAGSDLELRLLHYVSTKSWASGERILCEEG